MDATNRIAILFVSQDTKKGTVAGPLHFIPFFIAHLSYLHTDNMYPSRRNLELPTSPINKLPIELLSEIFTLCTQDACRYQNSDDSDSSCPPAISSESVRVPLTLASVNHRWRAIVHGQPSLWTSLCISPELITETYESSSTSRTPTIDLTHIQSCLQRSKQSSLNILIDARDPHWNFAEAGSVDGFSKIIRIAQLTLYTGLGWTVARTSLLPHYFPQNT